MKKNLKIKIFYLGIRRNKDMRKRNKNKDKKIFICRICTYTDVYDYFVLAKSEEEAKEILIKHSPLMLKPEGIICMDLKSIKKDMIKENKEMKRFDANGWR
jgi:hypothetical protein